MKHRSPKEQFLNKLNIYIYVYVSNNSKLFDVFCIWDYTKQNKKGDKA